MKKTLILMCGIPASGKSSVAYSLVKYFKKQKSIIISMDNIREELFGTRKCQDRGDEVYAQSVEDTLWAFEHFNVVIYDATNRTRKKRKRLVKTIQKWYDCIVYCVFMNTDVAIALERNKNRNEDIQVPDEVIYRMANTLQPPTKEKEKYFEEVFKVTPEMLDTYGNMWYNVFVNQIKRGKKNEST